MRVDTRLSYERKVNKVQQDCPASPVHFFNTIAIFMFVKLCAVAIYSLAVYIFAYYLAISYFVSSYNDWLFDPVESNRTYDFIIVGAGSAGATLAAELCSEKCDVLIIDAGPPPAYFFDIPILAPLIQRSRYDWRYKTVPQKYACKGLARNQSLWPQGKLLGGSGRLNYMAYVAGHPRDYDAWFPEFSAYRTEDSVVNEPRWQTPLSDVILEALSEISPNAENDFGRVRLTMENGERWSADRLLRNKLQNGLRVMVHALVTKLTLDGNTARGVEFIKWGKKYEARARSGVIVSAGAIGSPKLLMLSGIGPKKHLESLGIEAMNDLPIGQNLVDHVLTGLDLITLNVSSPLSVENVLNPISALNYTIFRHGPWTSAGIEALGTFYSSSQNIREEPPDLQLMIIPVGVSQDNGIVLRKSMGISEEIFEEYFRPLVHRTAITIAPVLLHPKSFGEVKLASSNPLEDPLIDPKYLSHEQDVSTLIDGIQLVKRLVASEAMKKIGANLYEGIFPGCQDFIFDSREYWECYVRHLTLTSYHPAGTCGIGRVVDKFFRVLRMKNLYVVDASVLPKLPSGNINAAVMMLAKRASELLAKAGRKRSTGSPKACPKFTGYLLALYGSKSEFYEHLS